MPKQKRNQGGPQVPPMEEHYPALIAAMWSPPDGEGNRALMFHCPLPNKIMVFTLPADIIKAICEQGLAPTVITATPADVAQEAEAAGVTVLSEGS